MKDFVDIFIKIYSFVLFVNIEIEALNTPSKSEIGSSHFDNTTCPITPLKLNELDSSSLQNFEFYEPPKFKKKKQSNRSQLNPLNSTSPIPTYKDVLMLSASGKNKATCKNNPAESATEDDNKQIRKDEDLEVLLNEREWKKNFASIECGAKLIKSSKNLKHPNHIINKNNDEYMLHECKEETYFIIELCETIKVIRFELDNFELYSGTPKNFTIRTIDKYNNNPNEWIVIGNFEASSQKMEPQNFSDLVIKSFGKFIRVDVNSFHGTEHFCTLTSFRVFGMTDYEYLSLIEDEGEEENNTEVEEETIEVESDVENKLNELEIKAHKNEVLKEQTTLLSYKYLFLQMRSDICVESVEFESFTKHGIVKNKEKIQSIEYSTVEKNIVDVPQEKITDISQTIPKKVQIITKFEVNGPTATVPKESVLVQISNRVRILEKNITAQNHFLKGMNVSSKQQANDISKILDTILKAKAVFQETAGETENVKGKVNNLNKKVTKFEETIGEYAEALKLMMGITVVLSILCLFLISLICFKPSKQKLVEEEVEMESKCEDGEVEVHLEEESQIKDVHVQTDSPKIMKKVTFSDDEKEVKSEASDEDISAKLNGNRRIRRQEPKRRVTWCGDTLRKLTEEAKFLVKEM